jgi:hypothetical protein
VAAAAAVAPTGALAAVEGIAVGLAGDGRTGRRRAAKEALKPRKETAGRLCGGGREGCWGPGIAPWALIELRILVARVAGLAGLAGIAGLARLAGIAGLPRVTGITRLAEFARVAWLAQLAGIPGLPRLAVERAALRLGDLGLGARCILAPIGPERGPLIVSRKVLGAPGTRGYRGGFPAYGWAR